MKPGDARGFARRAVKGVQDKKVKERRNAFAVRMK
jgi:hypothetical protein